MRNLHNLDLMRAFAVILVLIDHTAYAAGHPFFGPWDSAFVGLFGVYLFFVHTCLVLMWSLERKPHVLNFYIRRFFRIYPLAITAILVALLFHIPVAAGGGGFEWHSFSAATILSNLLLIQDVLHRPNIVGVLWTLTIEVQMYLLLPGLFFLAHREKKLWQLILRWALAVLELRAYLRTSGNILPTVIPDFLPGVIAYLAFQRFRARLPAWTFPVFLCLLLTVYMVHPSTASSWPVALILGLALPLFRQIAQPTLVSLSHNVAKYSFGIYLWHSFGMKLSFHFLARQHWTLQVAAELLFTAVVSVATYHLIEEPLIRVGNRVASFEDPIPASEALHGA